MMNNRHFGILEGENVLANSEGGWERVAALESQYQHARSVDLAMGWENPLHLSQNPLIFSADHGITDTKSSLIMTGWPTQAANFRHHSQLSQAPSYCVAENSLQSPPALRSYGSVVEALQNIMHTGHESGFPGISTARHEIANDLKSLEQRRRFLGLLDLEHPSTGRDRLKEDSVYGLQGADPYDRIGLNLGGRTYFSAEDLMRLGKRPHVHATAVHLPICQADGCTADLTRAKHYYRRHKVCEMHSKAAHVLANGQTQRFCQQCSRLHVVSEFDDAKRSCRKRLADHNRRRRKPQTTAALQSGPAKMESTALKSEESEQSAANCISEAKSLAIRSKEQESSSDLEEPGGNNNGMVAHSLEYETLSSDFFRADCSSSSNNAMLQLNQARTSPESQPPSLKSTTNASTVMFPTSNYLQLPSPEIYRQNNVLEGSRQSTDPSLSLSHLGNRSSFEAQYQMLNSPSQSLFQESKTAAKWVNAANSYGGLTRSSIDFQQIMPVKHSHHGHLHDDAGFEHSYVRSKLPPNN